VSSIEERVATLEAEVIRLREQVTDAHTLAAHADRDVAEFRTELRAQTRLISALRETQVEQGRELGDLRHEVRSGFNQVQAGLQAIAQTLEGLTGEDRS
jgi:chromosome segregation ATPase